MVCFDYFSKAARIIRELQRSPLKLGYRTNFWTVETLEPVQDLFHNLHKHPAIPGQVCNFSIRRGKLENSKMRFLIFQYVAVWSLWGCPALLRSYSSFG
jgi:hypothetical protein